MKKRFLALLLCVACVFSMTACGNNTESTEKATDAEVSVVDENMPSPDLAKYSFTYSDYVTLCDFDAIPVELSEDYTVTDQDVVDYLKEWFNYYAPFYMPDDTKTVIEEGDIVDVDYVGKLDGVAFSGGSATNQYIDVSGNCSAGGATPYIDGFTAGLMGAEVGTTVDCNVTFPEEYGVAELNGKEVVFTFTVNAIVKEVAFEEINDEFAANHAGVNSVDEMYATVREGLEADAIYYETNEKNTILQEYLLENCDVEIPADYFADLMVAYREMFIYEYCDGDESALAEYLSTNYGYTVEEVEEDWKEALTIEVKIEFILGAIAETVGITLDEEAYEKDLSEMMSYYGITDKTGIYQSYGYGDAAYGEKRMKEMHVQSDVLEQLLETAVITVAESVTE